MSAYRMSKEMIIAIILPSKILYKKNKSTNDEIISNEYVFNDDSWNSELKKMNEYGWKKWLFHHKSSPRSIMTYITKTQNLMEPVTQLIVE